MNSDYNIKYITEDDIPFLVMLAWEVIIKNYSAFLPEDSIKYYLESGQCDNEIIENIDNYIKLEKNNEVIGFTILLENKLHLIMIANNYQNKGYGKKLLEYIEEILIKKYSTIELQSFSKNFITNRFYKKNGWENTDKVFNNGIELYKYTKNKI